MSLKKDELKFYDTNILDSNFNNWILNNSTVNNEYVSIPPGNYIEYTITDELIIKACMNTKIIIKASGDITDVNNYKSGPDIRIEEVYKVGDKNKKRTRKITITPLTASVDNNVYTNTTISKMLGSDMSKLSVRIINNTTLELKVYSIEYYRSKDIDTSQLYEAQKEVSNVYGLIIPVYYEDPVNAVIGQVWIRGDL